MIIERQHTQKSISCGHITPEGISEQVGRLGSQQANDHGDQGEENQIHIFLTPSDWESDSKPLADWKTKKGASEKIYIDDDFILSDRTISNVYDGHPGDHGINVKNAINDGQNLLNHCDHANKDTMGVGHANHSTVLDELEVDAFTNGERQSILDSSGCWADAHDFSDCIGEQFVRNPNGGGLALIGISRFGWHNPGVTNILSILYDINFFASLFEQSRYNLGECFSEHKNDSPTTQKVEKSVFTELTPLGNPNCPS